MREAILFQVQCVLHKILNAVLMPLGLYVCWLDYITQLEEDSNLLYDLQQAHSEISSSRNQQSDKQEVH